MRKPASAGFRIINVEVGEPRLRFRSRVADVLLQVFAIHLALSTPARRPHRTSDMLRPSILHVRRASVLLHLHKSKKPLSRPLHAFVEVGRMNPEVANQNASHTRILLSTPGPASRARRLAHAPASSILSQDAFASCSHLHYKSENRP